MAILRVAALLGAALSLSAARAANADGVPASDDYNDRLAVNFGLGSAVGFFGGTYSRTVAPWFMAEAGCGIGVTGPQLSLMPKLVLGPPGEHKFVMGLGIAAGIYGESKDYPGPDHEPKPPVVWWINADIAGYEYRATSGFSLLVAVGLATNLNAFHYDVFGDIGATEPAWTPFVQGRTALGWSF